MGIIASTVIVAICASIDDLIGVVQGSISITNSLTSDICQSKQPDFKSKA